MDRRMQKSTRRCGIYVINLERREDRLDAISSELELTGLSFSRIDAVDGKALSLKLPPPAFVSYGLMANWLSHQKCLTTFLESDAQYALILEDDVSVKGSSLTSSRLDDWVDIMSRENLDLLQVGYIGFLYKLTKPRGLLDLILAFRAKKIRRDSKTRTVLVADEFRAGAHAYIINKRLANVLVGANTPTLLATSSFLASIAGTSERFQFARLFKSALEQNSRSAANQSADSDA